MIFFNMNIKLFKHIFNPFYNILAKSHKFWMVVFISKNVERQDFTFGKGLKTTFESLGTF